MTNSEEAKRIKSEARSIIRKAVKKWKNENPNWISSESMTYLETKVSPNTFTSYKSILPLFCHWENTTPDQMITQRETQYRSEERKERYYYEDRLIEFQQFLVDGHYKPKSIKTILSRVSGFFANHRLDLNMDPTFWRKADKQSSELVQSKEVTKRYPDNDEVRLILDLASHTESLAILLGYQAGLLPSDIVSLTWDRLNIDFETETRDFIHVENMRDKTKAVHVFILNPDLLHFLRSQWIEQGKPDTGWVFMGYKDAPMSPRNLNHFFNNHAKKALGENRGAKFVFKDLRDSYNEIILDSNVNEEIKDTLMGHLRESAKSSYSLSIASVVRIYQEEIFPKLAVNGWSLKQKASDVDRLMLVVDELRGALSQVENENGSYKTRIDNLQSQVGKIMKTQQDHQEWIRQVTENSDGIKKDILDNYEGVYEAIASLRGQYVVVADPDTDLGLKLRIMKHPDSES
jgi:integrase